MSRPLADRVVELIARRFRALGEPLRIRLIEQLMEGEASVHELVIATGARQQNVSKHLGVLLNAGVVARRKEGTFVYYRIADEVVYLLCERVRSSLEGETAQLGALLQATTSSAS